MSEVQGVDASSILDRINARTNTKQEDEKKTDFLTLLVAQLQNQDPLKPQDGSEFMSQLAQLESVQGIQDLNDSFNNFSQSMLSSQALQATSMVGRNVLIAADTGTIKMGEPLTGSVALPGDATAVKLNIFNDNGELVRELSLGAHEQSNLAFSWDGIGDDGEAMPAGEYSIVAQASINGKSTDVPTAINFNVNSVTLDQKGGTLLNLDGQSKVAFLSDVIQIR